MDPIKILTANIDKPNSTSIDVYIDGGGYKAIHTALKMTRDEVTQLVKDSEMRGRGGALRSTPLTAGRLHGDTNRCQALPPTNRQRAGC